MLVCLAHCHLGGADGGHALGHQHLLHAIHVKVVGGATRNDVGSEMDLLNLRVSREVGSKESGAGTAAEVAGEVGEAGDLVGLAGRDADVVQRADRDEDEGESDDLEHTPQGDGAEGGVEIEACEVEDADGSDKVAETDHEAGVDLAEAAASDKHHEHHDEASRREDLPGTFGGIAEKTLKVLWDEDG